MIFPKLCTLYLLLYRYLIFQTCKDFFKKKKKNLIDLQIIQHHHTNTFKASKLVGQCTMRVQIEKYCKNKLLEKCETGNQITYSPSFKEMQFYHSSIRNKNVNKILIWLPSLFAFLIKF